MQRTNSADMYLMMCRATASFAKVSGRLYSVADDRSGRLHRVLLMILQLTFFVVSVSGNSVERNNHHGCEKEPSTDFQEWSEDR